MSVLFTDTDCEMDYKTADELKLSVIGMPYTVLGKEHIYDYGRNTNIKKRSENTIFLFLSNY